MNWPALALALVACQRTDRATPAAPAGSAQTVVTFDAPITPEYRADITALCDSLSLSGAGKAEADSDRMTVLAIWLGQHIATDAGHRFLVQIQPLEGEPKAQALEAEAHRVGLAGCALAAEWRK